MKQYFIIVIYVRETYEGIYSRRIILIFNMCICSKTMYVEFLKFGQMFY
jgi:hypothetical protein